MKRVKGIDLVRGVSMFWMFTGHILDWWLQAQYQWFEQIVMNIFDVIGATAFLFIAGVSTMISYRKRISKAEKKERYHPTIIKREYYTRASLLFIIGLIYNISIAIFTGNILYAWKWFILITIPVCLFLSWPLLKISRVSRICVAIIIFIGHLILLSVLLNLKENSVFLEMIYYFLYFSRDQNPILPNLPFFIVGTILGDIIFDIYHIDEIKEHRRRLKKELIIPGYLGGGFLVFLGVIYNFPNFLINRTNSWYIYALGIEVVLITTLIVLEELGFFDTKKSYRFLFYFSYFSLTVYLSHNIMYFLFLNQLNPINVWFFIIGTFIVWAIGLRFLYKRFGHRISLKYIIAQIATRISYMNEE
ncbi:MAG: heparan-alpha-glucosaminide N-acetyltransferase domain-containing protein [Promethearchaeia archaeon]